MLIVILIYIPASFSDNRNKTLLEKLGYKDVDFFDTGRQREKLRSLFAH